MSRQAWNQGKAVGQKRPLTVEQIKTIRSLLKSKGNLRDLALFSTAIDTMLRSVDLLKITVSDILDMNGAVVEEFAIQQQKTKEPVRMFLSPYTREIISKWIIASNKTSNDFIFTGLRRSKDKAITREAYRLLVKQWMSSANLDPTLYSTHSMRRTKASLIYKQTGNVDAVRLLLGQNSVTATSHYLGLDKADALEYAKKVII